MLIKVKVQSHAKKYQVLKKSKDSYEVWVKEKPVGGEANKAVVQILSKHLGVSPGKIKVVKGGRKPNKIIDITNF